MGAMTVEVIEGDLLDQDVEVIVNAWNRNVIPWWLLLPQGVSGAIKRRGGTAPFKEVRRHGPIPLGGAVLTSAGRLPFKAIIHVAGINLLWRASERSIRDSVRNAVRLAREKGYTSIAMPLIGAGAISIHKSQGQTLRRAVIFLDNCTHRLAGVAYTALSRCVSEEGLFLGTLPHHGAWSSCHAAMMFERQLATSTPCQYQAHLRCAGCDKWYRHCSHRNVRQCV